MTRQRVLVAGRPYDLSGARFDAFVSRHARIIDLLRTRYEVALLGLRGPLDDATLSERFSDLPYRELSVPIHTPTRGERLRRAAQDVRGRPFEEWETALGRTVQDLAPDASVTIGPWLEVEYRALFEICPSVHFFEEDLTRMWEIASQSRRARFFRALEVGARRRMAGPAVTVVISQAERRAAEARFPRSRVEEIPYCLDPDEWPLATTPSRGEEVLVVGRLSQERNAEGLLDVLRELDSSALAGRMRVRLVSADGLHPVLNEFLSRSWVEHANVAGDLWTWYRSARAVLVPAKRATGLKTTVLQGWAAGCPVVCFEATARTLGEAARPALGVGRSALEVVQHLESLWSSEHERHRLAAAGFLQLTSRFDRSTHEQRLLRILEEVVANRGRRDGRSSPDGL